MWTDSRERCSQEPGDRGGQEGKAAAAGADVQVGPPREREPQRAEQRGAVLRPDFLQAPWLAGYDCL